MLYDISLSIYLLAFLHAVLYFLINHNKLTKIINGFIALGFIINLFAFILQWKEIGHIPSTTLEDILQILILALILSYLFIYLKFKKPLLAMFILPIVIAIGITTFMVGDLGIKRPVQHSFWLELHLPFAIMGTALFLVSAITGLMYVILEKQLKKKNFGKIFRMFPPLNTINQLNDISLILGFSFFTIGLISGVIWGLIEWKGCFVLGPKLIFAFITWFIFGTIIAIKKMKGLSPTGTAFSSILGFFSIIITYFGVALFLLR